MSDFDMRARVLTAQLWREADEAEVPAPFQFTNENVEGRYRRLNGSTVGNEIVLVAAANVGYGELSKNNEGPFIAAIGGIQGREWCATFAGYCIERAYTRMGLKAPMVRSASAKRLTKNVAALGVSFKDPHRAKPGDLVCWHRGLLGWQGHVGIVERVEEDGLIHTIEGNVGKFPAKVKRLVHDVSKERLYGFASLGAS